MGRLARTVLMGALVGVLAAGIGGVPATAGDSAAQITSVTVTDTGGEMTTNAQCNITRGTYAGGMMCGAGWYYTDIQWSDGRWETFIVGWNQAVFHIYQRYAGDATWSGWISMGGGFTSGVRLFDNDPVTIYGHGIDAARSRYCKRYSPSSPGGWTGWYRC